MARLTTNSTILALLVALAGCAPSHAYLFDPVADSVRQRTGITPAWRPGWQRSTALDKRVHDELGHPLTADSAALIAVLNSEELQATYADLAAAGGSFASAKALPNPQLSAQLRLPVAGNTGGRQIELTATESVTALLTMVGRFRGADDELRATRRQVVARTIDLAARARRAFYNVVAAEQMLALRHLIADAAAAEATLAQRLRDAGNITELDLAREMVFQQDAELSLREAEAAHATAREQLNGVLALHGADAEWQAPGQLPDPPAALADTQNLERDAVAASLDLQALRWQIEAAGQQIGVARLSGLLPDLGIGVSAKREGGWGVGPMVSLSLPIFDWGQGARASAWARLVRLQHQYAAVGIELRAAARAAHVRLTAAHTRAVKTKSTLLPLRERLADESARQFNAMNIGVFELLSVRRDQIDAERRYIDTLREYWDAQAEVDELLAGAMPRMQLNGDPAMEMQP